MQEPGCSKVQKREKSGSASSSVIKQIVININELYISFLIYADFLYKFETLCPIDMVMF